MPEWNTLAASARIDAAPSSNTSTKCSGAPAPPEATSGTSQTARTACELLDVVAAAHAVAAHAVEHDLAGAALLHFAHPVERVAAGVARAVRIAGELVHAIAVVDRLAVDADDHALRAEARASSSMSAGSARAGELTEIFSAPALQHGLGVGDRADAAGDAERDVEHARHAAHPAAIDRAAFGARGDVVEHELVRAFVAIARGELQDVAHDA